MVRRRQSSGSILGVLHTNAQGGDLRSQHADKQIEFDLKHEITETVKEEQEAVSRYSALRPGKAATKNVVVIRILEEWHVLGTQIFRKGKG